MTMQFLVEVLIVCEFGNPVVTHQHLHNSALWAAVECLSHFLVSSTLNFPMFVKSGNVDIRFL